MFLERFIKKAYDIAGPLSGAFNNIGLVALVVIMVMTAADVTLRKLLNSPIPGSYEMVQFLMTVTIGFGFAHCAFHKGHITVDLFTTRLSKTIRGIFGCVTGFLSLAVCILVAWQEWLYVPQVMQSSTLSPLLFIPVFPFVAIVAFGLTLFAMILIVHFCEFILEAMRQ